MFMSSLMQHLIKLFHLHEFSISHSESASLARGPQSGEWRVQLLPVHAILEVSILSAAIPPHQPESDLPTSLHACPVSRTAQGQTPKSFQDGANSFHGSSEALRLQRRFERACQSKEYQKFCAKNPRRISI
ncbi:hypothetical protein KEM48_006392 [Puccinia striiformis f. sp. tritici PST-130]|nr:hypothetical protein KEM48_006392 [Puccinia striiformis f. sp. tritici PST-130]